MKAHQSNIPQMSMQQSNIKSAYNYGPVNGGQSEINYFCDDFYKIAYKVYHSCHISIVELKSKLEQRFSFLKSVTQDEFTSRCKYSFSCNNIKSSVSDVVHEDAYSEFVSHKEDSLYALEHNKNINYCDIRKGRWCEEETNLLICVLKHGCSYGTILDNRKRIIWDKVSGYIFGRNAEQCKDKFKELKKKKDTRIQQIIECKNEAKTYRHNPHFYTALTSEQEDLLFENIKQSLDNNRLVTLNMISEMARSLYYSPLGLATKALIINSLNQKQRPFDDDGNIIIPEFEKKLSDLLSLAKNEPQALIENYNITEFKGSKSWVFRYMMRHGLSYRRVHYERRGIIDEKQVDIYLTEIADAVRLYGIDKIVNMDETFVTTRNLQTRVVGLKGQETIRVNDENLNQKEGTTFIGTVCMDPNIRIPLGLISKGKTKRCEKKYGNQNSEELITHSENGWMTPSVMKIYLKWLHEMMGKTSFALILDVYRAHIEKSVKEEAKKLGIKLIFVPACATGLYQPLDRRLYGIIKKKLISNDKNKQIQSDDKRWENILNEMKEVWNELSENAIRSAWDIPKLNELLSDDEEIDLYNDEWEPEESE